MESEKKIVYRSQEYFLDEKKNPYRCAFSIKHLFFFFETKKNIDVGFMS